jgi:hypothetical protein
MNVLQKCDEILRYFNMTDSKSRAYMEIEEHFCYNDVVKEQYGDKEFYPFIIEHLIKELSNKGYIRKDERQVVRQKIEPVTKQKTEYPLDDLHILTVEGELFISLDGYKGLSERTSQENLRRVRNDMLLSYGTVLLAIGTFLLVAIEFLKWISGD